MVAFCYTVLEAELSGLLQKYYVFNPIEQAGEWLGLESEVCHELALWLWASHFVPFKQDGDRGLEDLSGSILPWASMLPNSKLTPSQIWPLATPAAITQRSNLLANHLLQFPYFWNIHLHNAATRNQEIGAARCSGVSCDLPVCSKLSIGCCVLRSLFAFSVDW